MSLSLKISTGLDDYEFLYQKGGLPGILDPGGHQFVLSEMFHI